ncbi:MAG TPA: SpoIIE family protein phosphatase [Thermoanaerobaculia bacterium]|jgi:serine phosphatase RsbU (regulator of sigma subunit)
MEGVPEPKHRRVSPVLLLWLGGIGAILALELIDNGLRAIGWRFIPIDFLSFFAWLLVVALTLYGLAVLTRWILRKLFWTVGRRLLLSYVMIGLLPFFLFAILLAAILYVIAGVASQASFRAERQASLGRLESMNTELALQGRRPHDETVEIYDTSNASGAKIPAWLRGASFSGMVVRDDDPLLVAARAYPGGRTVVLAQPLDERWSDALEDRTGMITSQALAQQDRGSDGDVHLHVGGRKNGEGKDNESNRRLQSILRRGFGFDRILFFDLTDEGGLTDWNAGAPRRHHRVLALISNPVDNLVHFYFGGATQSKIMRGILWFIAGLACLLLLMYVFASGFAAILIFSISRAVNRIEKGTRAVEAGDFTYRIRMKPHNQLGQMAQSFDGMTASIGSLLTSVAEKERLQSEIAIAASIQRNLLPKEGPKFRGVSFSAHFEPTASIGGDYYDVFNLDKSRLAVAIGDVSGHGLSTGLVMAMVKAAITTLVEEGADEESLFHRLNDLVYRSTERRAFMTLAFTIFDLSRGTIRHTNAGHLYPYLLRQGEATPVAIECPSLPLGVRHEMTTRTAEVELREGDTIVYLSDGVVEAQDPNGEPFGFDQLEELLAHQTDRSPSAVRDTILDAVAQHARSRAADDDRTVMVLRFEQVAGFRGLDVSRDTALVTS